MDLVYGSGVDENACNVSYALREEKIRVLIANPTRLLRDSLYDAIREQPGIEIVGDVSEEDAIIPATMRTNADCVIIPLGEDPLPMAMCSEILTSRPHVKIVAIGEGTNILAVYWQSKRGDLRCTYSTASRKSILQALRFAS